MEKGSLVQNSLGIPVLKECLALLQPFEEITKKISSSYSCISEVIPDFTILSRYLTKNEVQAACPNVNVMRVSLKEELDRRFRGIEDDSYYNLATLLDPRYKMNFFAQDNVPIIRRKFLAEFIRRSEDFGNSSSDEEEVVQPATKVYTERSGTATKNWQLQSYQT